MNILCFLVLTPQGSQHTDQHYFPWGLDTELGSTASTDKERIITIGFLPGVIHIPITSAQEQHNLVYTMPRANKPVVRLLLASVCLLFYLCVISLSFTECNQSVLVGVSGCNTGAEAAVLPGSPELVLSFNLWLSTLKIKVEQGSRETFQTCFPLCPSWPLSCWLSFPSCWWVQTF